MLCGLDGDDAKEGTLRLLRGALNPQDYPMLRLTLSARCIRLCPWHARKDPTAGSAKADRVLRDHGADAVLWGEVPKQGDSLRFFLRGAGRQETQIILFDKGLAKERPDGALGTVLAAVALSQITPVTEEAGHYLASRLRPVAARLEALLAEPRLVPTAESGNLHNALGMTLAVIGEQTGDNSALEKAVAAYRAALQEWTRERVPLDWAMTQNNLGIALRRLGRAGERDGAAGGGGRRLSRGTGGMDARAGAARLGDDAEQSRHRAREAGRAGERDGASGGGGRRLPRGAGGVDARAGAARLGEDAEQPRQRALEAWASGRAGRRVWRRRSPPTARRWRKRRASGCRSTGR